MKARITLLAVVAAMVTVCAAAVVAERTKLDSDSRLASKLKKATTTQAPASSTGTAQPTQQTAPTSDEPTVLEPQQPVTSPTVTASPAAGEQIKWQVISGGGGSSTSASYKLSATVGQTAAGPISSASYNLNQGFWQNFEPASCCVGTTGNVNMTGIVDLGDLAVLVAFLTNSPATKPVLPCPEEANINGTGIIDLGDLAVLVAFLTNPPASKPVLPNCP